MTRIYGLTHRRLLIHPRPLPDELLTHWFFRLAHENGFKAQGLADHAFGYPSSFWARDQDRLTTPGVADRIADLTGREPEEVEALTILGASGICRPLSGRSQGLVPWILPIGIFHRKRRLFGTQYCPLCLAGRVFHGEEL